MLREGQLVLDRHAGPLRNAVKLVSLFPNLALLELHPKTLTPCRSNERINSTRQLDGIFSLFGHLMLGKDKIQPQPKALAIAVAKYGQSKGSPEAQTEEPISGHPVKRPGNQKGNDPQEANQTIADRNSTDEKTVLPAIPKLAFRALIKPVKEVFQNRALSASWATVEKSPTQIDRLHRIKLSEPRFGSGSENFCMIGFPRFIARSAPSSI